MLIAIDTETGGTDPRRHALLSISACHVLNPENSFSVFILPEPDQLVDPAAAAVNGYTPDLWRERGAVPLAEAMRLFKAWLPYGGNDALAHNAPFDKGFIEEAERRTNSTTYLRRLWRCSVQTFMTANDLLALRPPNFKLETLARMAGHWAPDFVRGDHQSIDDVRACAAGYRWLMRKISDGRASLPPTPGNEATAAGELFVEPIESRLLRDIEAIARMIHSRHPNASPFGTWRECGDNICQLALSSFAGAKPTVSFGK
jgi:DNA polymerase III epsilon subunit-like protein